MMFQPRDIILLHFPFTDLSGTKLRPVLVLTAPNAQGDLPLCGHPSGGSACGTPLDVVLCRLQ